MWGFGLVSLRQRSKLSLIQCLGHNGAPFSRFPFPSLDSAPSTCLTKARLSPVLLLRMNLVVLLNVAGARGLNHVLLGDLDGQGSTPFYTSIWLVSRFNSITLACYTPLSAWGHRFDIPSLIGDIRAFYSSGGGLPRLPVVFSFLRFCPLQG